MNSIDCSAVAKPGSYGIWSQILSDLRIHRTAELSEFLNNILLSDLHDDARTSGHLLDHAYELWEHTLIYFEEFFGRWLV